MARINRSRNDGGGSSQTPGNVFAINPHHVAEASAPPWEYNNRAYTDDLALEQPFSHANQNWNENNNSAMRGSRKKSKNTCALMCFTFISFIVTFSRIIAGGVKLKSDCDLERRVAIYLFIKSWLAVFFWGTLAVSLKRDNVKKSFKNLFMQCYLGGDILVSLGLLILGTLWIFGDFDEVTRQCPNKVDDWDAHFINFAVFLTAFDYFVLVIFILFAGTILCDNNQANRIRDINH